MKLLMGRRTIWAIFIHACFSVICIARAQDITLEGGNATSDNHSSRAYDQTLPNMTSAAELLLHDLGQTGFLRDFGRVKVRRAIRLGPRFNAPSCGSCHIGNGRGSLRISPRSRTSDTIAKVSLPSGRSQLPGGPPVIPRIGTQLADHATHGYKPHARLALSWATSHGYYPDGIPYELRSPILKITRPSVRISKDILVSLRRAPPVFGSGLLEAVPVEEILGLADPTDANHDGISGRANTVWNVVARDWSIGRFGFKATHPTLKQQVAAAYATDMGITNPLFRMGDRTPDITNRVLDATTFYTATLAVPRARLQDDPIVIQGKNNFHSFGCANCHATELHTGPGLSAALANNTIHPFTDLLLHDMGQGLADGRPEFGASGSEWRTPPLWGIGLVGLVLGPELESYLHDGRARTLEEAILWHGGEATTARTNFLTATSANREALIRFLRSL